MTDALRLRVPRVGGLGLGQRKFLPLQATIALFLTAYLFGVAAFPGMREGQAFFNLFVTTPFLLICVVGETFVIISGGIDLSVSGIVALTTVAAAALIQAGWSPWAVMPLMLLMGIAFGAVMGFFIAYLKVQPFIATLAGMWLARGLCYIISDSEIRIYDPVYHLLSGTKILIPGLSDPTTKTGPYITILVVVAVLILAVGLFLAHYTRFGRTVYAIGGGNGLNEQSARLMGLPVDRTKVQVYIFSGFCSALAGIAYSIYVGSGHGTHATGFELTVIAAVVIGGTALTGGEGYLIGSLFGVLITALIQSLIQFNGTLSSWWTSIVIGALMLVFIGVQSLLTAVGTGPGLRRRIGVAVRGRLRPVRRARGHPRLALGAVAVAAIAVAGLLVTVSQAAPGSPGGSNPSNAGAHCPLKPMRHDQAGGLITQGAVISFERNGGTTCIDELFAIYPDGRITGDNGSRQLTGQITTDQVSSLLKQIAGYGWFTPDMYSTSHEPCAACYRYETIVVSQGQQKGVEAVDGGTDAPSNYWLVYGLLASVLPSFR